jgi:hypothetical protein
MLVFGGDDGSGSGRNDVWALSFAGSPAWSLVTPTGSPPPPRHSHTATYDPVNDRMVVFGGDSDFVPLNDAWALSLTGSPAWNVLAPAGTPPSVRDSHTAVFDPVRHRIVVFGGDDGTGGGFNDVWALSLSGSPAWAELAPAGTPPSPRHFHSAIYDPVRDRMITFEGAPEDGGSSLAPWALAWSSVLPVPEDVAARQFELAIPRPNPTRDETTLDFELAQPARVVLDVFDAQGRRVKRIADAGFTAGRHVARWRGDADDGHMLGAGLYFIRMQAGRFSVTRRTVRIR